MIFDHYKLQLQLERILPTVQKPGRYVGGELNQILKPWDSVLVFAGLSGYLRPGFAQPGSCHPLSGSKRPR